MSSPLASQRSTPAVQNLACLFSGEQEGAREDLGQQQEVELERSDDTEASATSPEGPKQIRLMLRIDTDLLATSSIAVTRLQARPCLRW
jgi:hypothetical protein